MKITLTNGVVRNVGSVSWGTLRNEDIIPSLLDECESCKLDVTKQRQEWADYCEVLKVTEDALYGLLGLDYASIIPSIADTLESRSALESIIAENSEMIAWLYDELFEMLGSIAPDYAYFGSTDGDGSDFGWWYAEVTEDSEGNTIVNPDDIYQYGYDSRYNVSMDYFGNTYVAYADNEADALDYVVDYLEDNDIDGYFLNTEDRAEAELNGEDLLIAGNHGRALNNGDELTIRKA